MAMVKHFSCNDVKVVDGNETEKINVCSKCGTANKLVIAVVKNSKSSCHKCGFTLEESCQSQK